MAYLNQIQLIGNVGGDPTVRSLPGGDKVANFTVATTRRYKDRNGEKKEDTQWHNIVVFGKTAETVERFVRKGAQVYVSGEQNHRKFTGDDGTDRYVSEVRLQALQLLDRKQDAGSPAPSIPEPESEQDLPF